MTEEEVKAIIFDPTKAIRSDIHRNHASWGEDGFEFDVEIDNAAGHPLSIKGTLNRSISSLSFAMIHQGIGRIYGLCLGKEHKNPPDGKSIGPKHKHLWKTRFKDQWAYVPDDISAEDASRPVVTWGQFCREVGILHQGTMFDPPDPEPMQPDLF